MREELLMIPGPVPVLPRILDAMSKPMIPHRGDEFKQLYVEVVENLRAIFKTRNDLFPLSGSGTCAMEAAIANLVDNETSVVCIANGKFGERFYEIAERYTEYVTVVNFDWGSPIELEKVKVTLESNPDVVTMVHNDKILAIH